MRYLSAIRLCCFILFMLGVMLLARSIQWLLERKRLWRILQVDEEKRLQLLARYRTINAVFAQMYGRPSEEARDA